MDSFRLIVGDYQEKIGLFSNSLVDWCGKAFSTPKTHEEDLDALMVNGRYFEPGDISVTTNKGTPNQCHANSANCWLANRDHLPCCIVTGYALFDGTWMQHSWVMLDGGQEEPTIVETTITAECYFGLPLTQSQCESFALNNA
ncbi:hypothetical protein AB4254_08290 [Vibrio breoganii]